MCSGHLGLFDRIVALAELERRAAADLATARRGGTPTAVAFQPSTGARYVSIPDVRVGFYVIRDRAREDVAGPCHLGDKLRRREP